MEDEWGVDQLDLDGYLERIGYAGPLEATAEVLRALHRAHVATVPFENLDVYLRRGVSVSFADVQDKLVVRRRGGYCYEHGTLFGAVLDRLGFTVERVLARVGDAGDGQRPRTHLSMIVTADGREWFADVGYGSGLLEPVPFDGSPTQQGEWTYRVIDNGDGTWRAEELEAGGWATRYRFAREHVHASDVLVSNHYSSTFPRSPFLHRLVAVRKDESTLHQLTNHELVVSYGDGRPAVERQLADAEVVDVLGSVFGIPLTGDDADALLAVWSRVRESSVT